jgi:hypothetical protein
MPAWTIKDRVRSSYTLGRYRLSTSFVSSIVSSYNTFIASAGAKSDAQNFMNVLMALDINTISGPEEIVAEDLIEVLSTFINTYNVRNSANTADIGVDVAIGGTIPTGSGNGLAKLNSYIATRTSTVAVANSIFVQKVPMLFSACETDQANVRVFFTGSSGVLITKTENAALNNVFKCYEEALRVASGTPSARTVVGTTKATCETQVDTAVAASGGAFRTSMTNSATINGAVKQEVCAQFYDV